MREEGVKKAWKCAHVIYEWYLSKSWNWPWMSPAICTGASNSNSIGCCRKTSRTTIHNWRIWFSGIGDCKNKKKRNYSECWIFLLKIWYSSNDIWEFENNKLIASWVWSSRTCINFIFVMLDKEFCQAKVESIFEPSFVRCHSLPFSKNGN